MWGYLRNVGRGVFIRTENQQDPTIRKVGQMRLQCSNLLFIEFQKSFLSLF